MPLQLTVQSLLFWSKGSLIVNRPEQQEEYAKLLTHGGVVVEYVEMYLNLTSPNLQPTHESVTIALVTVVIRTLTTMSTF